MSEGTFQLIIFAIIAIAIAQIIMPFFVININSKNGIAIDEQRRANKELERIRSLLESAARAAPQSVPPSIERMSVPRNASSTASVEAVPATSLDTSSMFDVVERDAIKDALQSRYGIKKEQGLRLA